MTFFDKLKDFGSKVIKLADIPKLYGKTRFEPLKRLTAPKPSAPVMATIGIPKQEQIMKMGLMK